jgi:hypothetical protein
MSELLRQVYVSSSEYSETKVSYSRVARFSNKKFHFG